MATMDDAGARNREPGLQSRARAGVTGRASTKPCRRTTAWLLILLALMLTSGSAARAQAQDTPESRAFKAAMNFFQDGLYDIAQERFTMFIAIYPQSPMLPEAILIQARSALRRTNLVAAIQLLTTNLPRAGPLSDFYRYELGLAQLQASNYLEAAQSFAQLTHTNSVLILEASVGEAQARFKMRDFPRVSATLGDATGAFQRAARAQPNNVWAVRGKLLLGESLLEEQKFAEAERVARNLAEENLDPEYSWDRQHLLCRILLADRRPLEALAQTTNLVRAAAATARRNLLADSIAMQGGVLERIGRLDDAARAYTNNLADTVPVENRKLALLRIVEIKLSQDHADEATQILEDFLAQYPNDRGSDVALLTLGELQVKQLLALQTNNAAPASGPERTNLVQQALTHFDRLLTTQTNSPLRGKALLQKGWALWLADNFAESALAFKAAAEALPESEDQAVARFKLADAQFAQGNYTNALQNYRALTNNFSNAPRVREELLPHALFQMLRVSLELDNADGAVASMRQLLDLSGEGLFTERSMFVVGQSLLKARQPAEARAVLDEFLKRFHDKPLAPRVELSLARTYVQEGRWNEAIASYERWIERFPTNELRPRAEFNRGWACFKAGLGTDAFVIFTNFLARFPTHELAPLAQYWVGDYFYNHRQYRDAVFSYQSILTNTSWRVTNLAYQARLAAGRSAYAAQAWKDAEDHFTTLVSDKSCPDDIVAEAFFALGDTFIRQDATPGKPLQKFIDAITAFDTITRLFATNRVAARLVPLAWGRIGDCYLQLASQDPKHYRQAIEAYGKAMTGSDVGTRSLAEFGLASALELQAAGQPPAESAELLKAAFEHYYNILIGQNLADKEQPDPVWVEKAGLAAARLAEEQKQWRVAISIYERLQNVLPPLQSRLREKIDKAGEFLRSEKDATGD